MASLPEAALGASGARFSPCEVPAAASALMEVSPVEKALILVLPADAKGKEKAANKKAKAESDPVGPPGEGGLYVGCPK